MIRHLDNENFVGFEQRPPPPVIAMKILYLPLERLRPQVRFIHESAGPALERRTVHDYCLAMFRSATGSLAIDNERYEIQPNGLLVMPPFKAHQITLDRSADPTHIAIHCDLAPDFPDNCTLPERLPYQIRLTESLELSCSSMLPSGVPWYKELGEMVRSFNTGTPQSILQADAGLFRIIASALVLRTNAQAGKVTGDRGDATLARVLAYLSEHLADEIALETLARVGTVSVPHLNRLFRTRLGYPPRVYLTRLRITKARELLRDDRLSVKEVAARVGYPDSHSFGRIFHRIDGRTPSEYRATPQTNTPD